MMLSDVLIGLYLHDARRHEDDGVEEATVVLATAECPHGAIHAVCQPLQCDWLQLSR